MTLVAMPNVDEKLQERLEHVMQRYDYARGDYLRVLGDIKASGISWEDFTDLTGETVTDLKRHLAELRRLEKIQARFGD